MPRTPPHAHTPHAAHLRVGPASSDKTANTNNRGQDGSPSPPAYIHAKNAAAPETAAAAAAAMLSFWTANNGKGCKQAEAAVGTTVCPLTCTFFLATYIYI